MSVLPASAVTPLALESKASQLYSAAHDLMGKTHYLEALDLLDDARAILVAADMDAGKQFADILFAMAEAKTKGRLYQQFPAAMVKSALKEVQAATRLWERLHGIPAQKLSQGYYLEGYIHKRFFMRSREAVACFKKAVTVDPGNAAAKRELSELIVSAEGD
jgi:thioredoxin-like negative regulator of GroEL